MRTITLLASLYVCTLLVGCSGRTPNPVPCYKPGDGTLTCEELNVEMAKVRTEIAQKPAKIEERDKRNVGLLCFGFLIYPLFEIDTLNAEETELQALNTRYNRLFMIAVDKQSPLGNSTMTLKMKGGRDVTVNDILQDELPPEVLPLAGLDQ